MATPYYLNVWRVAGKTGHTVSAHASITAAKRALANLAGSYRRPTPDGTPPAYRVRTLGPCSREARLDSIPGSTLLFLIQRHAL